MSEATEQLERQLEANKELMKLRDVALKLSANKDFRYLIHDEYMLKETARLAQMAGDPILDKQQREDCMFMAMASGHLKRFLSITIMRGNKAEGDMVELQEAIDEVRNEEGAE